MNWCSVNIFRGFNFFLDTHSIIHHYECIRKILADAVFYFFSLSISHIDYSFLFIKNYLKRYTLDRETPIHINADEKAKNIDIHTY